MSSDALQVVRCLFTDIWSLFTSWLIPGTAFSPAAVFLASLTVILFVNFIKKALGGGLTADDTTPNSYAAGDHNPRVQGPSMSNGRFYSRAGR